MPTFYYSLFLLHILFALSTQEVQVKCLESNTHKPHPESESNLYGEVDKFSKCDRKLFISNLNRDFHWNSTMMFHFFK